jgi:hypothetical protein
MKKGLFLISFLILALGVGWWISSWNEKRTAEKSTQANAGTQKALEAFIPVLEKFKKEKGHYPSSLKALVPVYIGFLPKAPKDFFYKGDKKDYVLYFISFDNEIGQNIRYYSPKKNKWLEMDVLDWPREILEKREVFKAK